VVDRDQLDALVEQPAQRLDVELAAGVVRHHLHAYAPPPRELQEGDHVAGVLRGGREDAVARLQR
jgi:hypothetical protein